ncbi:FtsB family cell division protein [Coralliovum pocilloporae]|uniref:FtsB family cell division protein n=1 Tax=Coralliovum pocilloporae TaxID=3066369 RepID=UPI003306DC1A
MSTRQRKRRVVAKLYVPLLCVLCLSYFAFHALNGDYGVYAKKRMAVRIASLEAELAALQSEKLRIEHRVSLLKPESLDRDLIDELARRNLNYVHVNDIVVLPHE